MDIVKYRARGQGFVEYALLIALVAVVVAGGLILAGPAVATVFTDTADSLAGSDEGGGGGEPPTPAPTATPGENMAVCSATMSFAGDEAENMVGAKMVVLPMEKFTCSMGRKLGKLREGSMTISPPLPDDHFLWIMLDDDDYEFYGSLTSKGKRAFSGPIKLTGRQLFAWEDGEETYQAHYFGLDTTKPWSGELTVSVTVSPSVGK